MSLKNYDLKSLSILWEVSSQNVELRNAVEAELALRIVSNNNFSKDAIFQISKMRNHAITIIFIPSSDAFNNYGKSVTIEIIVNEEEMKDFLTNFASKIPVDTYGQIKGKLLVTDRHSHAQIERLATEGFDTHDILEILSI